MVLPSGDLQENLWGGIGSAGEPRFNSKMDATVYVNLPLPILAYNRHTNDKNVLLIPDPEFLRNGFKEQLRSTKIGDIQWDEKQSLIIWRGSEHVSAGYSFLTAGYEGTLTSMGLNKIHPRYLAVSITGSKGVLNPDIGQILDASFNKTTIEDMLKYKYQLDLDGMVSAWSGLFWKLYSNSVVFKVRSRWEQWYYRDLIPYVHFIPLENLSPNVVQGAFDWCERSHLDRCKKVAVESAQFARTLTYEYAVKTYVIH